MNQIIHFVQTIHTGRSEAPLNKHLMAEPLHTNKYRRYGHWRGHQAISWSHQKTLLEEKTLYINNIRLLEKVLKHLHLNNKRPAYYHYLCSIYSIFIQLYHWRFGGQHHTSDQSSKVLSLDLVQVPWSTNNTFHLDEHEQLMIFGIISLALFVRTTSNPSLKT